MYAGILFLDFDGVLHPRTSGTFRHAPLIEALLRRHPSLAVVVSSSWKLQMPLSELREWFAKDVQNQIVGVTPDLAPCAGFRQTEIEQWLRSNPSKFFLALDDERSLFGHNVSWVHWTDNTTGLTTQDIETVEKHLVAAGL